MFFFAMRPLSHPAIEDVTVEGILHALSDPVRVSIYAKIAGADCVQTCSTFREISERTIPKSTLSYHFKILREAGLIHSERKGVELQNHARCDELKDKFGPMITAILEAYKAESKKR